MPYIKEFDDFFHMHYKKALEIAGKIIPLEQGEDVLQICFFYIWQNWDSIQDRAGYLFTSVRNKSFDVLKHNAYAIPLDEEIEVGAPDELPEVEKMTLIKSKLIYLEQSQRRIIELALMGYGNKEIGLLLGITEQTIKNKKSMAIKKIKLLCN
jgi:RNA polymerase sigma factor (sigma-70 family)